MQALMDMLNRINGVLWHDYVLYFLLGVGILFTVWSGIGQFRALTHGTAVIRGKYDDKNDPGAINHFQALSTALSATVGLGNIAGVAIAISVGGPGAVFWMWVTGFVGMALKMTEVTQAMLFRNTDDPDNPHGGAMWVCKKGFAKLNPALAPLGAVVGGVFCLTLIVSCVTGGNMFQAWNVADLGFTYFGIPQIVTGIVLAVGVGIVIVGGIKRIGDVAGRIVPFMCAMYLLAGLYVIATNLGQIPSLFALIFREAFAPSEAAGAFIGGAAGFGFLKGMQRALFSNEAGQGSAPIAHSAAKTDEPVREGVVAGLEPFVDTICVCTVTALVILLSGTWNRDPALAWAGGQAPAITETSAGVWQVADAPVQVMNENEASNQMRQGSQVFLVVQGGTNATTGGDHHQIAGTLSGGDETGWVAAFSPIRLEVKPEIVRDGVYFGFKGATLTAKAYDRVLPGLGLWVVPATAFLFAFSTIISWSYYGEQGVVYLFGARATMPYRLIYCGLVVLATTKFIRTEAELDTVSTLGTGVMLWANIPIMLIFGPMAMKAYHEYMGRYKRGEMVAHKAPPITEVIEGSDVE
ncbi:MAG: sodium:alanine symporter family protein [Phycisphaerales bacterium]|nr:sodium:alanine symporter family protein [Phycisphaerales bacterium]